MSNTIFLGDNMEIVSCGYNFEHDKKFRLMRPNGLNEYLFLIIRSYAVIEINSTYVNVSPNSIVLIRRGTKHNIIAASDNYINDWVGFSLDKEQENLLCAANMALDCVFCSPDVLFCSEIIKLIQIEAQGQSSYKNKNTKAFLKILFNKYYDISHDSRMNKAYFKELYEIRERIYNSPLSKYTVEILADEIHLSKSYFHHLYKEYFHTHPISDIIAVKIDYAKQLLATTSHSITDIATMLDYPSDSQFIKQFKKISGITPGKYRKMF